MIILVVGNFGVGKDTFADFMLKYLPESIKIKSFTTREPRFDGEDTHIFTTPDKFPENPLAYIDIEGVLYWTSQSQFDKTKNNIYVIADCGLKQVMESDFDNYIIIEIVRPKSLIDVDEERLGRKKNCSFNYTPFVNFTVINDDTLEKLEEKASKISKVISSMNSLF